jgi:hypothetical protein
MSNLKYTRADVDEAFFNLGKMAGRLPADEGKRLAMLSQIIASFLEDVMEENKHLRNGDEFDIDGRC